MNNPGLILRRRLKEIALRHYKIVDLDFLKVNFETQVSQDLSFLLSIKWLLQNG